MRVGIIDGGFLGYLGLLGSSLPDTVTAKNFVDGETDAQIDDGSEHGTACAEIIHNVAPGAQLLLAKTSTVLEVEKAVEWLTAQHVDIISTSIGWIGISPGDGTGRLPDLIEQAREMASSG